ncbi:MAG: ribosomal protein L13e [Candidatus Bathyarchaeia archaeon]
MDVVKPKVFKKDAKQRFGKGFSRGELEKAGITLKEALKRGIPVDPRRKTTHEENAEVIKKFLLERCKAKT